MMTYLRPKFAFLIGLAGGFVALGVRSLIHRTGRPVAVATVREVIALQAQVLLRWNELTEDIADIRAQARHDLHAEQPSA